ncbi:GNAT family N-acetyltransferase [Chryseobacterium elymi]|nr:GNAT family N-acetyltransferase [Chryseobacterium elymi]
MGRIVLVDNMAVYDRIVTAENHQRKGIATCLMHELEKLHYQMVFTTTF